MKEKDAQKALKTYNELCNSDVKSDLIPQQLLNKEFLADYDISHLVKPVYLGFGDLAFKTEYKNTARRFFDAAVNISMNNMEPVFEDNRFIHPQYLIMFGKNDLNSIDAKNKFYFNGKEPVSRIVELF